MPPHSPPKLCGHESVREVPSGRPKGGAAPGRFRAVLGGLMASRGHGHRRPPGRLLASLRGVFCFGWEGEKYAPGKLPCGHLPPALGAGLPRQADPCPLRYGMALRAALALVAACFRPRSAPGAYRPSAAPPAGFLRLLGRRSRLPGFLARRAIDLPSSAGEVPQLTRSADAPSALLTAFKTRSIYRLPYGFSHEKSPPGLACRAFVA